MPKSTRPLRQAQIGVLVTDEHKVALEQRAIAEGLSLSNYCARILTATLAEEAAA